MFTQRRNAQAGLVLSVVLMTVTLTILYRGAKDAKPAAVESGVVAMKNVPTSGGGDSANQSIKLAGLGK